MPDPEPTPTPPTPAPTPDPAPAPTPAPAPSHTSQSPEWVDGFREGFNTLAQKLDALPETIANSIRESTPPAPSPAPAPTPKTENPAPPAPSAESVPGKSAVKHKLFGIAWD